jgi:hypothetical protein
MTEVADRASTMEWEEGTKATLPNATLSASCFISMTACTAALPASSSLFARLAR